MVNKEQALKAVKYYARTGNKEKACLQAGYSKMTARTQQTAIIERGTKQLAEKGGKEANRILEALGKSRQDIINSYNELAFTQNRDLKLKAQMLAPLYQSEIGIDITGKLEQDTKQPILNVTLNQHPHIESTRVDYEIE